MSTTARLVSPLLLCATVFVGCGGGGAGESEWTDPPLTAAASDSLQRMQTVLAWVGDRPLTAGDVVRHIRDASGGKDLSTRTENVDVFHIAMNGLLDQLVWGEVAKLEGYSLTPEERRQVHALETLLLATRYVAEVIEPKAFPPREEVEDWYRENQGNFVVTGRVAVRHILVASESEARDLMVQAQGGADFVALVREHSLDDQTKLIGGALGYVSEHGEVLGVGHDHGFVDAVLPLDVGDVTVVQTAKGWHVVKIEDKQGGGVQPLEEVYDSIKKRLLSRRWSNVYNEELAEARERTEARVIAEGIERVTGVANNSNRLLSMAIDHPEPGGRIELLRRITFDFPESAEAPEAQFRIGFTFYEQGDARLSTKALMRLQQNYPDSPWRKAGDWLMDTKPEPEHLGTPEEILQIATGDAD